jgi:hypothetical protein
VRPPIGEALAPDAAKGLIGALGISTVPVVVAEIELAGVAAQMRFADMVINADDAALEDGEEILDRVRVPATGLAVLARAVVDRLMLPELLASLGVCRGNAGGRQSPCGDSP